MFRLGRERAPRNSVRHFLYGGFSAAMTMPVFLFKK